MVRQFYALALTAVKFSLKSTFVRSFHRPGTFLSLHPTIQTQSLHPVGVTSMSLRRSHTTSGAEGGNDEGHVVATTPSSASLTEAIISGIQQRANPQTREWFTNYVKGTTWIGCKIPVVREAVQEAVGVKKGKKGNKESKSFISPHVFLDAAIILLQHEACDVKLGGMLILSEQMKLQDLATHATLQRLEDDVLLQNKLDDWSSADWFAIKVLKKIVFSNGKRTDDNDDGSALPQRVLNYTTIANIEGRNYLYVRRCGVVPFLDYGKHRDKLPPSFGSKLVDACEASLLASSEERFTQTGIAWVLRYILLEGKEKDAAIKMIIRHGTLWTKEAKKSMVEKLPKNDSRRKKILELE
jgi:hypothetical protein